jgi:hypothetical protein
MLQIEMRRIAPSVRPDESLPQKPSRTQPSSDLSGQGGDQNDGLHAVLLTSSHGRPVDLRLVLV